MFDRAFGKARECQADCAVRGEQNESKHGCFSVGGVGESRGQGGMVVL